MRRRQSRCVPLVAVIALLSSYGCEYDEGPTTVHVVGPSAIVASPLAPAPGVVSLSRGFLVHPALIQPVPFAGAFCPAVPPLVAPFSVVFEDVGAPDLFLNQLQVQFVDRFGTFGGSMFLGRTELLSRFGSLAIPAFGTRAFPLSFRFGCVGAPAGILTVAVFASDSFGRVTSTRAQVAIR